MKKLLLCTAFSLFCASNASAYFEYVPYEQPKKMEIKKEEKVQPIVKKEQKVQPVSVMKKQEVKAAFKPAAVKTATIQKKELKVIPAPSNYFLLKKGSLANQLKEYSEKNGYTMIWKPQNDIILDAETSFQGTYKEVVQAIFEALNYNNIKMNGILYSNKVLEVVGK